MTISGQKQLSPCPIGERAATVEKMVLEEATTVPTKIYVEEATFFFSRDDNRRVPSKNCSSAIAPKHEWFGSMYDSHFSATGKSLLRSNFCRKQFTNRESSPNAR